MSIKDFEQCSPVFKQVVIIQNIDFVIAIGTLVGCSRLGEIVKILDNFVQYSCLQSRDQRSSAVSACSVKDSRDIHPIVNIKQKQNKTKKNI